jgi:hypothetical protein
MLSEAFRLPDGWSYFAARTDLALAVTGAILIVLLSIWWSQQTRQWLRVVVASLFVAMLMNTASLYLFESPPHQVGCPDGCTGYRGFPLPIALITLDGQTLIAPLDFALNLLLLWLLWLTASVAWMIFARLFRWGERSLRWRVLFIFFAVVAPWSLLPRLLDPPQPSVSGEDLRIAINGQRAAEFTYRVTGAWVLRLALEDIRRPAPTEQNLDDFSSAPSLNQVCLRGYTYFYIPWRRYRIDLDATGVTPIALQELLLSQPCWPS